MNATKVEAFSTRLSTLLSALPWQVRNDLLMKIGQMELRMRSNGQERPLWRGPAPEVDLLGSDVVVQTDQGERRGTVIAFGVVKMPDGIDYERSVVVHVPSSGTHHEAPGSLTKLATQDDHRRMEEEVVMAQRLADFQQSGATPLPDRAKPRKRGEKDPALIAQMLEVAQQSKKVRIIEDTATNHKIVGLDGDRRIYLFKTQLRVDISGFSVDHVGIRKISDAEAREMHLGKVRGQLLYDNKPDAMAGFLAALELLGG